MLGLGIGLTSPSVLGGPLTENLFSYSEQIDHSDWVKSLATVSANAANDPNGLATADKVIPNATSSASHRVFQDYTVDEEADFMGSVYLKSAGYNFVKLLVYNKDIAVDLTDGSIVSSSGDNEGVESIGDGWYRVYCGATSVPAGNLRTQIIVYDDIGLGAYSGDTTSGALAWGAQLETGTTMTGYVKTEG